MLHLKSRLELIYLTCADPHWRACEIDHFWPFAMDAIFKKESTQGGMINLAVDV